MLKWVSGQGQGRSTPGLGNLKPCTPIREIRLKSNFRCSFSIFKFSAIIHIPEVKNHVLSRQLINLSSYMTYEFLIHNHLSGQLAPRRVIGVIHMTCESDVLNHLSAQLATSSLWAIIVWLSTQQNMNKVYLVPQANPKVTQIIIYYQSCQRPKTMCHAAIDQS